MKEEDFNKNKQFRIQSLKYQIDNYNSGLLLQSLELELKLIERQTYQESIKDRRFITND